MCLLGLIALGLDGRGKVGSVRVTATIEAQHELTATETPLGLVIVAHQHHGADRPTVTVTGAPVLLAQGVDVWRGEWLAPVSILAGGP